MSAQATRRGTGTSYKEKGDHARKMSTVYQNKAATLVNLYADTAAQIGIVKKELASSIMLSKDVLRESSEQDWIRDRVRNESSKYSMINLESRNFQDIGEAASSIIRLQSDIILELLESVDILATTIRDTEQGADASIHSLRNALGDSYPSRHFDTEYREVSIAEEIDQQEATPGRYYAAIEPETPMNSPEIPRARSQDEVSNLSSLSGLAMMGPSEV